MTKRNILAVVSYLFPIVGLILWLLKRKKNSVDAKVYGKAALYFVVYYIVYFVIASILNAADYAWSTVLYFILLVGGAVLVVRMARKAPTGEVGADGEAAAANTMRGASEPQKKEKTFFLKRWIVGLGNAMDRWLFKITPDGNTTIGLTAWYEVLVGFIGGGIYAIIKIINSFKGVRTFSLGNIDTAWFVVFGVVALIPIVLYAVKSIREFDTVKVCIFRGLFIVVWCLISLLVGCGLGIAAVYVVAVVLIIWFVLKMFGAAIFGDSGSSKGRRWKLDDGTEVKEERGLLGETYYTGDNGISYDKNSDDTFSQK